MGDTYAFLIREPDWDSDAVLSGDMTPELTETMGAHGAFYEAVAALGATLVGGEALQNARHGGVVTPGADGRQVEEAVYTDSPYADSSELITGFYLVQCTDDEQARRVASMVPTGGTVEWRKVLPRGEG